MRRLGAKALAWSALTWLSAAGVGGTGCTAKQPTELVPGISSQMVVPRDLTGITVEVKANGAVAFCKGYTVSPETHVVDLPSTLGVIPAQSPNTVIEVTVRGYDGPGSTSADFQSCGSSDVGSGPRILRRSIQTYVDQHTLFLPMPLSYACVDKECPSGQTCKGNECVDPHTASSTLVDFDPTLIDGTGLCFSPKECFGDTVPAEVIDPGQCIYGFPSWETAASDPLFGNGINVKVYYQDWTWQKNATLKGMPYEQVVANAGEVEILNADVAGCGSTGNSACEGFTPLPASDAGAGLPEASFVTLDGGHAAPPYNAAGVRFQLAPGLCDLVHAGQSPPSAPATGTLTYHTISDVQVAAACAPKQPLLPICAAERNNDPVLPDASTTGDGVCNVSVPLTPAPSVLYLVMDNSAVMHGALGPGGSITTLAFSFGDPVFKRTYAGFKYFTGSDGECTANMTGYTLPTVPACTPPTCSFNLVNSLQPQVASALNNWAPPEMLTGPTCQSDSECVTKYGLPYCYIPNPAVPEGGAPEAGADAGDGGGATGNCLTPQNLDLQAAMRIDFGAYAQVLSVVQTLPSPAIAGVMFFVNRVPQTPPLPPPGDGGAPEGGPDGGVAPLPAPVAGADCPPSPNLSVTVGTPGDSTIISPQALSAQQVIESEAMSAFMNSGQSLQTYFVVLDNDEHTKQTTLSFFQQIQTDLQMSSGAQPVVTLNATDVSSSTSASPNASAVMEAAQFSDVIVKLGTCLYELPQELHGMTSTADVKISYRPPQPPGLPPLPLGSSGNATVVPVDTGCNATSAAAGDGGMANGWNFDNGRIRVCGAACQGIRTAVQAADIIGQTYHVPTPDVPILITPLCTGSSSVSDATTGG